MIKGNREKGQDKVKKAEHVKMWDGQGSDIAIETQC